MGEPETVKFEIKIPKDLWEAFTWYVQQTSYWVSNDYADKSYNSYIVDALEENLKAELGSCCELAANQIRDTLKEKLGIDP